MSKDPVPLSDSLNHVLRSLRGPDAAAAAGTAAIGGVFGRWSETVGETIAKHVQPVKLDGGTLVVEVDDPAWATQLKFLEENLRERLLESTGARVHTFEVRVRRHR